jgi:uncharacterized DUF497 family protein
MNLHERFDWDQAKATLNEAEHDVTFEEAKLVLEQDDGDIYLIEFYDDEHSVREDRYCTFGSLPTDRSIVLRITWTPRDDEGGQLTRIISARAANRRQRLEYAKEIRKRLRRWPTG